MAGQILVSEKGKSSIGRIAFLTLFYFFYIYSFQIPGMPHGVIYYRVALVLMFAYACISSNMHAVNFGNLRTSKMVKKYLGWNVFLLAYVGLILWSFGRGSGYSVLPSYINMFIILPLFFISSKYIFRNVEEVMTVLYIGCIIQALIIIVATLNPSLETALKYLYLMSDSDVESVDNIERMVSGGYHMGFQCFTSQGVLKMAMGLMGACYFMMKSNGPKFVLHLLVYLFITVASSLLARTGMFISLFCLLVVFLYKGKRGTKGLANSILIILMATVVVGYIVSNFSSNSFLNENFGRYIGMFTNGLEETYFDEWRGQGMGSNVVPPISYNTIIGLGIKNGVSGAGVETVVDGGFLINYSSMGLIMAIVNYLIVFLFFFKQHRFNSSHLYKSMILIMFIIFVIGEIKEHYLYQFYYISFMFLIFYLMEKEERADRLVEIR